MLAVCYSPNNRKEALDLLATICHLAIVNVCVITILSIGNTLEISILILCFLYSFVDLMIKTNE